MKRSIRTEQTQSEQYVNCLEACQMVGLNVIHPGKAIEYYQKTKGFPRGCKIGRWRRWKVSEVLAWRENQHAMSR